MGPFKRIDHVEIVPSDVERTIRFYTEVLGFEVKSRQPVDMGPLREVVYLTLGDTMIELLAATGAEAASTAEWQVGYRALALEVEDMDQTVAYLQERGVPIVWGPVTIGPSKRAEIRDPDGLAIELRQW